MTQITSHPSRFIGCDVDKANIVVFDSRDRRTETIPNRIQALAELAGRLDDTCLVICEATGGYESLLLDAMIEAGRPVHRADARKVKAFIRSFGILGKTDAIDAKALARYGQDRHESLTRWQAADPERDRLQALVLQRRDMVAQRTACINRIQAPGAGPVERYLTALLDCLETQIERIEREIDDVIARHDELRRSADVLKAIAGVGARTAAALLALMPELGRTGRRQIAALANLAPHPVQSGATEAYRRTRGGQDRLNLPRRVSAPAGTADRAFDGTAGPKPSATHCLMTADRRTAAAHRAVSDSAERMVCPAGKPSTAQTHNHLSLKCNRFF